MMFQLAALAIEWCSTAVLVNFIAHCKAVRPSHSFQPKIRLTEPGTDLITMSRCPCQTQERLPDDASINSFSLYHMISLVLSSSFKTVVTSRNIIVSRQKIPGQKVIIQVMHTVFLSSAASCDVSFP
jgi:hypothetical protein